jgi:hypothetical protein
MQPTWPLLTIVIPVHGVGPYVAECLDSILADAPERLQVICVDDASPDGVGPPSTGSRGAMPGWWVTHLPENRELGPARNVGLERARGEYVWFVDGDDRLPTGAVATVMRRLSELRPDLLLLDHPRLHSDSHLDTDPHEAPVGRIAGTVRLARRPRLLEVRQAAWNRVVHRDLIDAEALCFPAGWYEDVGFSHLAMLAPTALRRSAGSATTTDTGPRAPSPAPRAPAISRCSASMRGFSPGLTGRGRRTSGSIPRPGPGCSS